MCWDVHAAAAGCVFLPLSKIPLSLARFSTVSACPHGRLRLLPLAEPTPRNRRIVMAKRATFAEVCLRPVQCFILLRQSCVFKFVCARKMPAQHRPMQSCAWNRVFHHSRPHNSRIGSGWKTAFISPMLNAGNDAECKSFGHGSLLFYYRFNSS